MVEKLLDGHCDAPAQGNCIVVDQVAITNAETPEVEVALAGLERHKNIDLAIAYEPPSVRGPNGSMARPALQDALRRLGILRGRPGIGFPGAVHLERFGAPGRVLVTDDSRMTLLGGLGVLAIPTSSAQVVGAIASGSHPFGCPKVIQILLAGRLNPTVSARDVYLELLRQKLDATVRAVGASGDPVILEFSGPGLRALSVHERALLCSLAPDVGACSALACSDEKTELFLRDQRRSKAHRLLTPDAGSTCAEVVRVELAAIEPQLRLADGSIVLACDRDASPVHEVVLGGDVSGTLRDMLCAAQWFKAKRAHLDVDLLIVPATRQTLEAMVMTGTLGQLLSAGGRLHVPDPRFLDGTWQPPSADTHSLRSFTAAPPANGTCPSWTLASVETLCHTAINGRIQDPRLLRRTTKVSCPRELPIDDCWLVDRKAVPTPSSLPPPARATASRRDEAWDKLPASAE
jgi:aconitate hydratase